LNFKRSYILIWHLGRYLFFENGRETYEESRIKCSNLRFKNKNLFEFLTK